MRLHDVKRLAPGHSGSSRPRTWSQVVLLRVSGVWPSAGLPLRASILCAIGPAVVTPLHMGPREVKLEPGLGQAAEAGLE